MNGTFISFEGPEGCGKSTQIQRLADRLTDKGLRVITTREPGGTRTGESIRNILQHDAAGEALSERAELLLFAASRAQLMQQIILPALDEGQWVLCDRFIDSTIAYQGFARGMDMEWLHAINQFAIADRKPDLTILLDLEIEEGFQRLAARSVESGGPPDRFEREDAAFHQRVREGYHSLVQSEPDRFCVVDASRSIDQVADQIGAMIEERWAL